MAGLFYSLYYQRTKRSRYFSSFSEHTTFAWALSHFARSKASKRFSRAVPCSEKGQTQVQYACHATETPAPHQPEVSVFYPLDFLVFPRLRLETLSPLCSWLGYETF